MTATFSEWLGADDRAALLAVVRERRLDTGEALFRHGEAGDSFALVGTGRFKLVAHASGGREILLGLRGPGELIGELAILDHGPRTADVVALEPATVGVGSAEALRHLLHQRPSVAMAIIQSLSARLREADDGRMAMATLAGHARVAVRLLELASRYGLAGSAGTEIALPLSQDEIADWTGLSRPAVARALAEFRRIGCVTTGRRRLVITDLVGLQSCVETERGQP